MLKWKKANSSGSVGYQCLFRKPDGRFGVGTYLCAGDSYVSIDSVIKFSEFEEQSNSLELCF